MHKEYQGIVVNNPHDKPTSKEISEIEQKIGIKLPQQFLRFLNIANGAEVSLYEISLPNYSIAIEPQAIFTTKADIKPTFGNFAFMIDFLQDSYIELPKRILPFMKASNEIFFFLDLRDEKKLPVLLLKHGRPAWTGQSSQDELIQLVENFEDFTKMWHLNLPKLEEDLTYAVKNDDIELKKEIIKFLELAVPDWRLEIKSPQNQF